MVSIELRFIAGRFHATPWGRHVNEGVPEWPPSPWRLLRSLVALWYRDATNRDIFINLLNKLAEPPQFHLPPASQASTQHYMPVASKSRLAFDTFLLIEPETPVYVIWPNTTLTADEKDLLTSLLEGLTYFGRYESWADARLVDNYPDANSLPMGEGDGELVRVIVPETGPDILENVQYDTRIMRNQGLLDPPGSKWVNYTRPVNSFAISPRVYREKERSVNIIRFSLFGKPLPRITETVAVGELARVSAMAKFGRQNEGMPSPLLSGKDPQGNPLRNHKHGYYLPTDEDGDGVLDHLTVYIPEGISGPELSAVTSLRQLNSGSDKGEIGLFLLGTGLVGELECLPFAQSDTWVSVTPFVLGRFPKYYRTGKPKLRDNGMQIDGPMDQVHREWNLRRELNPELPKLLSVEPMAACSLKGRTQSWASFRMWRNRRGGKTPGQAYGFQLHFSDPVSGPICLGYGSHFGLGMFYPANGVITNG